MTTTNHPTTKQIADIIRALPDSALCAVWDIAQWGIAEGWQADAAQTEEDFAAIDEAIEQIDALQP